MLNLMYGFETNISKYELKDIFLWLLVIFIFYVIVGQFIGKRKIHYMYFKLIRLGRFSKWWYQLCGQVFLLSLLLTVLLFSIAAIFQYGIIKDTFDRGVLIALMKACFLFFLNFFTMNMAQMVIIHLHYGEKLSFLIISVLGILSLYFGIISEKAAHWMPASLMMYYRSSIYANAGFSVWISSLIQIVLNLLIIFIGHRILIRRR